MFSQRRKCGNLLRLNMTQSRPTRTAWLAETALLSIAIGLIYLQFHWFGNTTEVQNFGPSAFGWMVALWRSARIFGGSSNWLGWVIPLISIGLVLLRSRDLMRVPRAVWWPGLAVVMLAVMVHWAGARAQQTRLSLLALILLIWSIPLFLYGWKVARQLIFPVGLLVFCVPLNFLDAATFPMRILGTGMAVIVLNGFGFTVDRAGSMILGTQDAVYGFDGSDPASGVGVLLMLVALGCLVTAFMNLPLGKRITFVLFLVPAMILGNASRLALLCATAELGGVDRAEWLYEHLSTPLVFFFSLFYLFLMYRFLLVNWSTRMKTWIPEG